METTSKTLNHQSYPEYKLLDLPKMDAEILKFWDKEDIFNKSVEGRPDAPVFSFYDGPPSANGMPGIHHVMARTIKDLFCRYQTLKGCKVPRTAGWDTHGLPIELSVEKELGITKEDIGKTISIEDYNKECRVAVLRYKEKWDELTRIMGYWIDLENPYITYNNEYIETVWNLLKQLHDKKLLYKGYSIQPYSPAAGTGLSSAELNQPGTYQDVKDTTVVAQFKVKRDAKSEFLFANTDREVFILAWTTTPWTLPSNTALAVGEKIEYIVLDVTNKYTGDPIRVVLATDLLKKYSQELFGGIQISESLDSGLKFVWGPSEAANGGNEGETQKTIAKKIQEMEKKVLLKSILHSSDSTAKVFKGADLVGVAYEQLLPYVQPEDPEGKAFHVIPGDFVTTTDGTGIVHIAPTFGADDMRVAQQQGVPGIMVKDAQGNDIPLVDRQGRFVPEMGEFGGRYVKNYTDDPNYESVDVDLAVKLKTENRAFKVEKYEHSYPHCWRTDKPVLYYPLDSWFVKTTAYRDRMVELNKTINWKPESTGTGRFGNWLENLVDWNLSRSRFWGIPLPIWVNEGRTQFHCVGSIADLKYGYVFKDVLEGRRTFEEAVKSYNLGAMSEPPRFRDAFFDYGVKSGHILRLMHHPEIEIDLHRPFADHVFFKGTDGELLIREPDLIDVWFDSGSMPYAQFHFPFENKEEFESRFPADFIAEGVDQTRGWFFTLHAIAVMLFDSVAYKNVVSNGLVQAKDGQKMSKRLGNAVDPFALIGKYGADPVRWYMMGNANPWENLRFNPEGVDEVRRKTFSTLYNTYNFFAMYANVDGFTYDGEEVPYGERSELDRWILSKLHSLIRFTDENYADYEPTRVVRAIEEFIDILSNWYVRLSRRRFWKGEMNRDKEAAYQTLYECLIAVAKMMSPIAPFYGDKLYTDLNKVTIREEHESVHLSPYPVFDEKLVDTELEERMELARTITSLVHSIRKDPQNSIKTRQPLARVLVPVTGPDMQRRVEAVRDLILSEVNVKALEFITDEDETNVIVKTAKANFKVLGPRLGKEMKNVAGAVAQLDAEAIRRLEREGQIEVEAAGQTYTLSREEVEIRSEDIPGWKAASEGGVTVALDVTLTEDLVREGLARELVNRIQNLRKTSGLEVTDRIRLRISDTGDWKAAANQFLNYICAETLADSLEIIPGLTEGEAVEIEGEAGHIQINR